ncbi:MAG: MBL fold metallo-hydrolase [Phycisphaerales bacterium]|nr:MBL fold metallo-hydrolase [Phycisphaerales bacterium]
MQWIRSLAAVWMVVGFGGCTSMPPTQETNVVEGARYDAWLLGRVQDGGLPHLGCERPCCEQARASGHVEYPCALGIRDRETGTLLLIEATPAVEPQIAMLHDLAGASGRGRTPVDGVLITHAHIGHYTGLMQFGEEVAATKNVPLHITPRMAEFLRSNDPWAQVIEYGQVDVREVAPGHTCEPLEGLRVEFIEVPHREEHSDTVAFKVHGPARTLLWVPDVDQWGRHDGLLPKLLEGVDVAYVDATFYDGSELPGRDLSRIPHPFMVETMQMWEAQAADRPGVMRFIHMNHTNPVLHDQDLREQVESRGFRIAEVGEHQAL